MSDCKGFMKRLARERANRQLVADMIFIQDMTSLNTDPFAEPNQLELDVIAGKDTGGFLPQYAPMTVSISGSITPEQMLEAKERAMDTASGQGKPQHSVTDIIDRNHKYVNRLMRDGGSMEWRGQGTGRWV